MILVAWVGEEGEALDEALGLMAVDNAGSASDLDFDKVEVAAVYLDVWCGVSNHLGHLQYPAVKLSLWVYRWLWGSLEQVGHEVVKLLCLCGSSGSEREFFD